MAWTFGSEPKTETIIKHVVDYIDPCVITVGHYETTSTTYYATMITSNEDLSQFLSDPKGRADNSISAGPGGLDENSTIKGKLNIPRSVRVVHT